MACSPLRSYKTLQDLVAAHASDEGGLVCTLTRPCVRTRAQRVGPAAGNDGVSTQNMESADDIHAESDV